MDRFENFKTFIYKNYKKGQEYTWEEIIESYCKEPNTPQKQTIRRYLMGLTVNHNTRTWYLPSPKIDDNVFIQINRQTIRLLRDEEKNINIAEENIKIDTKFIRKAKIKNIINIPDPNSFEIEKSLKEWKTLEKYVLQEKALSKLFIETYPKNIDIDEVLIKVCSLNDFYSTSIFSTFKVAKHILNLNIDEKLLKNDLLIVNEIAKIKINESKTINYFSFATKYCSHHKPDFYPIFDNYVEQVLAYFNDIHNFYDYRNKNIREYKTYYELIQSFQNYFDLQKYKLKEIDRYLWLIGKKYFKREYKKKK